MKEANQIYEAIKQSNVWELKRIFTIIGPLLVHRYLNCFWGIDDQYKGKTFLHIAINLDLTTVKFLFKHNQNPNVFDLQDNTPLHQACLNKRHSMIRLLIQNNAKIDIKNVDSCLPYQLFESEKEQNEIKAIIDQCVDEMSQLKQLKSDKKLPFSNESYAMNIVTQIQLDTNIDELLNIVVRDPSVKPLLLERMNIEYQTESEIENEIEQDILSWIQNFKQIGIQNFEQLTAVDTENWPLMVDIPIFVIYAIEILVDMYQRKSIKDIEMLTPDTPLKHILEMANRRLKNKYTEDLKALEDVFYLQEIHIMEQLQNMTTRSWRAIRIPADISAVIKSIIEFYNKISDLTEIPHTVEYMSQYNSHNGDASETNDKNNNDNAAENGTEQSHGQETAIQESTLPHKKYSFMNGQEKKPLLKSEKQISCFCHNDTTIHVGTLNGVIYCWELEIESVFHKFELKLNPNDAESIQIPLFMDFMDSNTNKNEQLVIATEDGCISCYHLHSQYPRLRAKNIDSWQTHFQRISDFKLFSKTKQVVTISFDGFLKIRDLSRNGQIIHSIEYNNVSFLTMECFFSETDFLIGTENGCILNVNIKSNTITDTFSLSNSSPITAICINNNNSNENDSNSENDNQLDNNAINLNGFIFFSYETFSIGILEIETFQFIGKIVQGFGHHLGTINQLCLRNNQLWSCSEDDSIRIWDLSYLSDSIAVNNSAKTGKKIKQPKKHTIVPMPQSMVLADSDYISAYNIISHGKKDESNDNGNAKADKQKQKIIQSIMESDLYVPLLEAWSLTEITGTYHNGIQKFSFMENEANLVIAMSFQQELIGYNCQKIDSLLKQKISDMHERRQQLLEQESMVRQTAQAIKAANAKAAKKGSKGGKKTKKK